MARKPTLGFGMGGLPLRQIADKAKYIVLVPLVAGTSHIVEMLYKSEWTGVILTSVASGGATVILAGSLWLADKVFGGVKHLDTAQERRLPKITGLDALPTSRRAKNRKSRSK